MAKEGFQEPSESEEYVLRHLSDDLISNLVIFPQRKGVPAENATAPDWEQKRWVARVVELSRPRCLEVEETSPTDWAALQEQYNLEKENQRLRAKQAERREWIKKQLMGLPDQWRAFRKAELLEGLCDTNPNLEYTDYEEMEKKKGMIFAQHGLPVEYLQADHLCKNLQAVNQLLIDLNLDRQAGNLRPDVSEDNLQQLQGLKETLYLELQGMDKALKQRFPLAWLINGLRWILERLG